MIGRRILLIGPMALAGCGLSERPYQEKREWPLVARRPETVPARAGGLVVLVRDVRAAAGLEARGLRTLRADGSLSIDFYEEWSAQPAGAVEENLRQWLVASGLFAAVLAPGSRLTADLVVEPSLDAFVADRQAGVAHVTIGIVVIDQRRGASRIVLQAAIRGAAPLTGNDPTAVTTSIRAALADGLGQAERLLAGLR